MGQRWKSYRWGSQGGRRWALNTEPEVRTQESSAPTCFVTSGQLLVSEPCFFICKKVNSQKV